MKRDEGASVGIGTLITFIAIVLVSMIVCSTIIITMEKAFKNQTNTAEATEQNGKIIVDGYDINKVDINSYRKQLGVVMQDPYLFNGTISENIAITKRYSTSEEIIRAANMPKQKNL